MKAKSILPENKQAIAALDETAAELKQLLIKVAGKALLMRTAIALVKADPGFTSEEWENLTDAFQAAGEIEADAESLLESEMSCIDYTLGHLPQATPELSYEI